MPAIHVKDPVHAASVQSKVVSENCTFSRSDCGRHLQYTAQNNQQGANAKTKTLARNVMKELKMESAFFTVRK